MNSVNGVTLHNNLNFSEKAKNLVRIQRLIFLFIFIFTTLGISAQEVVLPTDTTTTSPAPTDSIKVSGIETTIKYYAQDSIITKTATNITYLYGNAYIDYGDIRLEAARIIIDQNINELSASGIQDSTGAWIGLPIFKDGPEEYETREIRYNFVTNRAKIKGVATQHEEGYLSGQEVKKDTDGSIYVQDGKFTPCGDPLASTYIKAKRIKMTADNHIVTGPFLLYVGGIPTILGLPFGIFPDTKESSSGVIFPKYGTEELRGIFLRDGGYYFSINDYVHTALTGDVFSKGSWGLKSNTTYRKRYRYSGNFTFTYNRNKSSATDEQPLDSKDFWISWSHRPESRGKSNFTASVNAGSSTYNQNNVSTTNFTRNVSSEFRSNVAYSSSFLNNFFNYSLNARHSQNVESGIVDLSLPEFALNMNRLYPFKGSKTDIMKKFTVGWNFNVTNRISNYIKPASTSYDVVDGSTEADTIAFTVDNFGKLLQNAQNGGRHSIPIATSFPVLKHLNATPSITFNELWYLQELNYSYDDTQNAVKIDTIQGFSRANTFNTSIGVSTQLYGMYNFRSGKKVEAIRHIIRPSVGFSYRPDYGQEKYGYYQTVQIDSLGNTRELSKYDGFVYGSPTLGETAAMSFSISNNVEMKVRSDTSSSEKVPILENLSLNAAYNFLAEDYKLSNISISGRTSLLKKKLTLNFGATIDPYTYLETFDSETMTSTIERIPTFAWKSGQGIGTLRNARFSLSSSLNSKASTPDNSSNTFARQGDVNNLNNEIDNEYLDEEDEGQFGSINDGGNNFVPVLGYTYDPNAYIDLSIPWNIRLSYDFNYSNNINSSTTRQAVKMYGQMSLTPKWRLTVNTGYDIDLGEITQTSLGIYRDLGCWEMQGNWIPFGRYTSFNIDIHIKAAALKDLKLNRRRSFYDN